jgi:hypothetical protein
MLKWLLTATLLSTSAFGSTTCVKVTVYKDVITANKTDMRDEAKKLKTQGWMPWGKLVFKDYAFRQTFKRVKCQ